MKCVLTFAVLGAMGLSSLACSSEEGTPDREMDALMGQGGMGENTGSAGAAGAAGSPSTPSGGGSGSAPEGQGGSALGGSGGSETNASGGGSAGGSMTGAAGTDMAPSGEPPACMTAESPSDGVACSVTCTDPCGIHNLGSRVCTCTAGAFDCASCAYAEDHPLLAVPEALPFADCPAEDGVMEDDESGCTENERCQSIRAGDGANRFCGCLGGEWDCDSKPQNLR